MRGPRGIFALALVAAALAVAGCGGDEEGKGIPAVTATALGEQLDNVQARIQEGSVGACKDILEAPKERGPNKQQVEDLIDSMPDDVDPDVKSALQDSFDNLWDLVQQECDDKASKEKKADTTPTETQTEETTPTEAETETETTPTTETQETTPTTPEDAPLPNDGNGNGNGNDGGVGNGGGVSPNAGDGE
jgi:hypothetical protein